MEALRNCIFPVLKAYRSISARAREQLLLDISLVVSGLRAACLLDASFISAECLDQLALALSSPSAPNTYVGALLHPGPMPFLIHVPLLQERLLAHSDPSTPFHIINVDPDLAQPLPITDPKVYDPLLHEMKQILQPCLSSPPGSSSHPLHLSLPSLPLLHPILLTAFLLEYPVGYTMPPSDREDEEPRGNCLSGRPLHLIQLLAPPSPSLPLHLILSFSLPQSLSISLDPILKFIHIRWSRRAKLQTLWPTLSTLSTQSVTLSSVAL
ncbi:MAG: hypothetical protein DHS80DRAFT_29714 [Piptocephalis tieghemiana]|nr:MAG: hypothetical protein DHS80DRAFT_29714 [Piptocephalis tieghemiana]